MSEQIRFSQFVIDKIISGDFSGHWDWFGNKYRPGSDSREGKDSWSLYAEWFFGKRAYLSRNGKQLTSLTKEERIALYNAYRAAMKEIHRRIAIDKEAKKRQLEADHWWP